jgi:hypothetical protein
MPGNPTELARFRASSSVPVRGSYSGDRPGVSFPSLLTRTAPSDVWLLRRNVRPLLIRRQRPVERSCCSIRERPSSRPTRRPHAPALAPERTPSRRTGVRSTCTAPVALDFSSVRKGLPCLFCGNADRPKSNEHVIQRSFGAEVRLRNEVCEDCNTRVFSAEDKRFVDIVKGLICYPQSGFPGLPLIHGRLGLSFDAALGVWTATRLMSDGFGAAVPQIVQAPSGSWLSFASDLGEAERMFAELGSGSDALEIDIEVIPGRDPKHQLSLLRTAPRTFVVRGSDDASTADLVRQIRQGQFAPYAKGSAPHVRERRDPIELEGEIPLGSIARSLAKNTVNFICEVYGSQAARHPALNKLKDVIMGRHPPLTGDLVTFRLHDKEPPAPLDEAISGLARHAMMILPVLHEEHVRVATWLYRTYVGMVAVPMDVIPSDSRLALLLIDDEKRHQLLKMPDDLEWFAEFFDGVRDALGDGATRRAP